MFPLRLAIVAAALALAGCSGLPDTYAPPMQRQPLQVSENSYLGAYAAMNNTSADAYIVKDISTTAEGGSWRWTFRRPELQFFLPSDAPMKFVMEFAIAGQTFARTGPVTLSVFINDKLLGHFRYDKPGSYRLEKPVPAGLLKADSLNNVAIEPDKVWVSPADGAVLGFILTGAGFRE